MRDLRGSTRRLGDADEGPRRRQGDRRSGRDRAARQGPGDREDAPGAGPAQGLGRPLNDGTRLLDKLAGLPPAVRLGRLPPDRRAAEVLADLTKRIDAEIARFDELVDAELPGFNATIAEAKFGAVALP